MGNGTSRQTLKILILGGTTEARLLAEALALERGYHITHSLAGVTRVRADLSGDIRTGGFGGVDGLIFFLQTTQIDIVIDATHPFASKMSWHAAEAATACAVPILRLIRPSWHARTGDLWTSVPGLAYVPDILGVKPKRVFLTTGRQEIRPFLNTPHHYLLRSIDPPDGELPSSFHLLLARGPFSFDNECALLRKEKIDCLVTKNSGADATRAKLDAACILGLPVIMVERPALPPVPERPSVEDALSWIQSTRRKV